MSSTPVQQEVPALNLHRPVDRDSPEWQQVAATLQGNIVKGHGRDYSAHILFTIGSRPDTRLKLKGLAERYITSARGQEKQSERYRSARRRNPEYVDKQLFGSLYLSASGYQALNHSQAELDRAFPDPEGVAGATNWFLAGMEQKAVRLSDPPRSAWEPAYCDHRIDAMLLLACDDEEVLRSHVNRASKAIARFGKRIQVERGITLREKDSAIEHFGFADGISQPGIFANSNSLVLPRHLLVPDILSGERGAFGSYLVYRKLEQDVEGFELAREQLAKDTGVSADYAGAMIVGRFKDGTPLTHSTVANGQRIEHPDLSLHDDIGGSKCPLHSHIRKVNPRMNSRGGSVSIPLVRRGVPYGPKREPGRKKKRVGLLFLAFQSDIGRQFGVMTAEWVNNPNFPEANSGTDALIGSRQDAPQKWPGARGGGSDKSCALGRFVTFRGGEFFFAPSLTFFRTLS